MPTSASNRTSAGKSPIKVAIADGQNLVRAGLRSLVAADSECDVVGEAVTPAEMAGTVRSCRPDVLISEVCFARVHPFERLKEMSARTRVVVVSSHEESEIIRETMQSGVHGYLTKDAAVEDLHAAVRAVADGGSYLHPSLGCALMQTAAPNSISVREGDVVALIARGLTTNEIAVLLFISPRSVESARASVRHKVGAETRADLCTYAANHGYLLASCAARLPEAG